MSDRYRQARFLLSSPDLRGAPADRGREVAFAGRSNSGKSSALNTISQRRNLARTSKTPGRTQQLVFFDLDGQRRLVDLPGYGFAKVAQRTRVGWQHALEAYLRRRRSLQGLILTMDIRHPLTQYDRLMLDWCAHAALPVHALLTKADKLKRGAARATVVATHAALQELHGECSVQLFSAPRRCGLDEAVAVLDRWLYGEEPG